MSSISTAGVSNRFIEYRIFESGQMIVGVDVEFICPSYELWQVIYKFTTYNENYSPTAITFPNASTGQGIPNNADFDVNKTKYVVLPNGKLRCYLNQSADQVRTYIMVGVLPK